MEPQADPKLEFRDEWDLNLHSVLEDVEDDRLSEHLSKYSLLIFESFLRHQYLPQKNILQNFCEELKSFETLKPTQIVSEIDRLFSKLVAKGEDILEANLYYEKVLEEIPVVITLPIPHSTIYVESGDSLQDRLRKYRARPYYWLKKNPTREVPARKIAQAHVLNMTSDFTYQMLNNWYHLLGRLLVTSQHLVELSELNLQELSRAIKDEKQSWLQSLQDDFLLSFTNQTKHWTQALLKSNSPLRKSVRINSKEVEEEISKTLKAAAKISDLWTENFIYFQNRLKVSLHITLLTHSLEKLIEGKFFQAISKSNDNMNSLVEGALEFLKSIQTKIENQDILTKEDIIEMSAQAESFQKNNLRSEMMSKYVRGSFRLLNRDISMSLSQILPREERVFSISSSKTPADKILQPTDIQIQKVDLYELYEQSILINFLPLIEEKLEGVSNYLEYLFFEMEQVFVQLNNKLTAAQLSTSEENSQALADYLLSNLTPQIEKISELYHSLNNYIRNAESEARALLKDCQNDVREGLDRYSIKDGSNRVNQNFELLSNNLEKIGQKIKDQAELAQNFFKKFAIHDREREVDRTLLRKIQSRTLDTTTIRQYIQETYSLNDKLKNLPSVYSRLFTLDPIRDRRFFIAHQQKWHHFEPLTQGFRSERSQKILILGDRGMGKTSLLNIAQVDINVEKLIRIESSEALSLLQSLANALEVRPQISSILSALRKKQTAVIIDNFDHLIDKKNLAQTDALFEIIQQSEANNHWILSLTKNNFYPLDRAFRFRSLFTKIIDLHEVPSKVSKNVLLCRHRLSGVSVEYPKGFVRDISSKIGLATADQMFFRVLYERSHGHLRHLIYLWLLSIKKESTSSQVLLSSQQTLERGLPMVHEFSNLQKYILSELYSHHYLTLQRLCDNLGVSLSTVDSEIQYLESCGLIRPRGMDRSQFEIPLHLVHPVGYELKKEGVLYEASQQQ